MNKFKRVVIQLKDWMISMRNVCKKSTQFSFLRLLIALEETNSINRPFYSDSTKVNYPPVAGKSYYGRGPKQLSWNYNYGQFSEAWFGSKDKLLVQPDLLSKNPVLSFASAIWFWMTPQYPKPSCHDIMVGKWIPTNDDIQKGRVPGFGATVNVINGGVECGNPVEQERTFYRYKYFHFFCNYFHVAPGENISCKTQKPFTQWLYYIWDASVANNECWALMFKKKKVNNKTRFIFNALFIISIFMMKSNVHSA